MRAERRCSGLPVSWWIACLAALVLLGLLLTGCDDRSGTAISDPALPDVPSDSVLGDLREPPQVTITRADEDSVFGTVDNVDLRVHRVVLWAKTDRWYVQPRTDRPFTVIGEDGRWANATNPWERLLAAVVGPEFVPEPVEVLHPSTLPGVLGWDEWPEASARTVAFAGREWHVKMADSPVGPGPNRFSARESAVWVDEAGLHLRTEYRNGSWYSAEVFSADTAGYGVYTFELTGRVDLFDVNTILGLFIYQGVDQEFDFEFSRSLIAPPNNAQFVVQPWHVDGNLEPFVMPAVARSSHRFEWRADRIEFISWRGGIDEDTPDRVIHSWTYTGEHVPVPDGERIHLNLYSIFGDEPAGGKPDEILISDLRIEP